MRLGIGRVSGEYEENWEEGGGFAKRGRRGRRGRGFTEGCEESSDVLVIGRHDARWVDADDGCGRGGMSA